MRTPRSSVHPGVDLLAVVVLSVIALAGLEPSFAGTRWMVVGGFGLTLGVLWAAMLVSLRLGVDLVIESLPIPYVFTAGLLALGSSGLFLGVPDADTLGQVVTGTFTAWRDLAETAPPVDSAGSVLLIPYALAMYPSGTALAMALRSERPTLPAVPLLVALGVVLVLGTHTPLSALWHGLAFGAVALLWVGHRSNRVEAGGAADAPREASGVSLARIGASVVVVAIAAAVVLPLVGTPGERPRWLVREAVEPYDSTTVRTPLTDFRRFRKGPETSLADEVLFAVRGVRPGTRVRLAVLDDYDGTTWSASSDADRDDPMDRFLRVSSTIDNPGRGARRDVRFQMKRTWDLDWLPVVGKVRAFSFYDDTRHTLRDQVRYNRSTSTALLPGGIAKGRSYLLDTQVNQGQLRRDMEPWPEPDMALWEAAEFLALPTEVWSTGALTEMDAVFRVAKRLRQRGRYSDGASGWESKFAPGQSEERLGPGFVDATAQVGNDEQYAATMALMANRLGVPARVVVGAPVPRNRKVMGRQVHAWVEVRIADGSWRTLPTSTFMSKRPPKRTDKALPRIRRTRVPEQQPQQEPRKPRKQQEPEKKDEPEKETEDPAATWWRWLGLCVLAVGLVPGAKAVRRRRRRGADAVSRRFAGAWDELLDTARDLGVPVSYGTRPQQAAALGVPVSLARAADVATFSAEPPSAESGADYWDAVAGTGASLRGRAPRWRRWLAPLNPASLLPRRR